jgi:hypothetical protein
MKPWPHQAETKGEPERTVASPFHFRAAAHFPVADSAKLVPRVEFAR